MGQVERDKWLLGHMGPLYTLHTATRGMHVMGDEGPRGRHVAYASDRLHHIALLSGG
jgi:hypothetical protein